MWQFLGEHRNAFLALLTVLIWGGALMWFFNLAGYLREWREKWRTRRDRQVW